MAYKALILDLDGTLVESLPGIEYSANTALAEYGFPTHSTANIRSFIGDGSWTLLRRAVKDVDDSVINKLNISFKESYAHSWESGTKIFSGILSLLKECLEKDIQLAVLSNKPHPFTVEIIHTLFTDITFDVVMGQQEGITQKPAPDGTLLCLEKLNVAKEDTLFIGDSTIDLQTAKNAGTACAAVTWGYHNRDMLEEEGADHFATTVDELTDIIFA